MSENNSDDDIKKNYNGKRKRKSDESFAEKKIKIEHDVFNCNGMKGDEEALSIASSSKWLNPVEMSHVVDSFFRNLRIDLKRYLKEAVQISSISFGAAIDLLHNFLADGSSITLHPDFPKKPPSSFVLFCKKRGDVKHGIWHFKDLSAMWKNDDYKEEKLACEKESLDLQRNYMENLEKFKYCDLEPEKRNKKLLKKFNKLSDDQRAIYQSLASAL
ncbi:unnamed protein product [Dracunculus medinensis]|uniref:HMG box domain-containing protein n=1 Tax=Dracunculus medinensis TaxID=318479 RepID=A0A0N4UGZ5_DRAME|nr:unnamed protein product [Dracunculus medinensis]